MPSDLVIVELIELQLRLTWDTRVQRYLYPETNYLYARCALNGPHVSGFKSHFTRSTVPFAFHLLLRAPPGAMVKLKRTDLERCFKAHQEQFATLRFLSVEA